MTPALLLRRGPTHALKRFYFNRALARDAMTRPLLTSSSLLIPSRNTPYHHHTYGHGHQPERTLDQRPRQVPYRVVPPPRPRFAPSIPVPGFAGSKAAVMYTIFVAERTRAPPGDYQAMTFTAKRLRPIKSVNSPVAPAFVGWNTEALCLITVVALTHARLTPAQLAILRLRHPNLVASHRDR